MQFTKSIPIFLTISSLTVLSIPNAHAKPALTRGAAEVGRRWLAPLVIGLFAGASGENVRAANNLCTKHVKRYNADRLAASKRLNYYKSQGWDTSALRAGIASRREAFEHEGYKNGCTELENKIKSIDLQKEYYNY